MKKILALPARLLGVRFGLPGIAALGFVSLVALASSSVSLTGSIRLQVCAASLTVFLYSIWAIAWYGKLSRSLVKQRVTEIENNQLLVSDEALKNPWMRRPLMQMLTLFGSDLAALRAENQQQVSAVQASATQIAQDAAGLAKRAEEIAAMLEETSTGIEQFAGTVERSASSCQRAHLQSAEVQRLAEKGVTGVRDLANRMQQSEDFAAQVTKVLASIDEIAVQTNILALNASIEAARAGDQGRAFAVVAAEVRKLAIRTSSSTQKVSTSLSETIRAAREGQLLARGAIDGIEKVLEQTRDYTKLIGDIAVSASEQTAGVEQIKLAIEQMANLTHRNASAVEQMTGIADNIQNKSAAFNIAVSQIHRAAPVTQ
jgi:methyl-accepting chemotaxis protein